MQVPMFIIGLFLLLTACTKNNDKNNEAVLLGVWVNNKIPADTLWFVNKSGKNILRYNIPSTALLQYIQKQNISSKTENYQ